MRRAAARRCPGRLAAAAALAVVAVLLGTGTALRHRTAGSAPQGPVANTPSPTLGGTPSPTARSASRPAVGRDVLAWQSAMVSRDGTVVTVLPAPTYESRPTVTGATSWVSEPMNAPASIVVWNLLTPS